MALKSVYWLLLFSILLQHERCSMCFAQVDSTRIASSLEFSQEAILELRQCFPRRERTEVELEGAFEHLSEYKSRHSLVVDRGSEARFYSESWVGRTDKTLYSREVLISPTHSFLSSKVHFEDGNKQLPKVVLLDDFAPFHGPNVSDLIGEFAFFAGYAKGLDGLDSLHSDSFARHFIREADTAKFELIFRHRPTSTRYFFSQSPNGQLGLHKIEFLVRNKQGDHELPPALFNLLIKDRNEEGEVTRIVRRATIPNAKNYEIRLIDTVSLEEGQKLLSFERHSVDNGVFVVDASGKNRVMQYWEGSPHYVVDPIAEAVIDGILGEGRSELTVSGKVDSKFVRSPYLRRSSDAAHCGIYSFAIAAAKLGRKIDLEELVSNASYVAPNGSSALQLVEAAEHYGIKATVHTNSSVAFLRSVESPCLLHYGNSHQVEGTDHWVALLSIDDNYQCEVVDLPNGLEKFPVADLMTYWDGTVVVLSDQDGVASGRFDHLKLLLNVILPLVFLVAIWTPFRRSNLSTLPQFAGLLLVSGLLSLGWAWWSPFSFLNNPTSVHIVRGKVPSEVVLPETNNRQIFEANGIQIVDARLPATFLRGHIDGAVNIPVDCSLGEMRSGVGQLDVGKRVVVYCQSHQCMWGHALGNRLAAMGFDDIVIFSPGWSGYVSKKNNEK